MPIKNKRQLSAFLDRQVKEHLPEIKKIRLDYIFCNDAYLLNINQQFLDHNTYTDIITFDMSEQDSELKGEIYVSLERISENAVKYDTSFAEELHRVIFHGALHLCGYSDKKTAEKKEMRQMEDSWIRKYREETNVF